MSKSSNPKLVTKSKSDPAVTKKKMSRYHVTVLGAMGGIGQSLSHLLKRNPKVRHLSLYDMVNTAGLRVDLSHLKTPAHITSHQGPDQLLAALKNADVVVIVAGVTMKPGETRDDVFGKNAKIIGSLIEGCAAACPKAFIAIVTNPVNSLVPLAVEVLKKKGIKEPEKRVFGVTTLDVTRAGTFAAEFSKSDKLSMDVPVIGGHAGITIIPLISQQPRVNMTPEQNLEYVNHVQKAWKEVQDAKEGKGTATMSTADATEKFVNFLMESMDGHEGLEDYAYVRTDVVKIEGQSEHPRYFATKIAVNKDGVKRVDPLPWTKMNQLEKELVIKAIVELKHEIKKGEDFASHSMMMEKIAK